MHVNLTEMTHDKLCIYNLYYKLLIVTLMHVVTYYCSIVIRRNHLTEVVDEFL